MRILVTGATGFIGSALIEYLVNVQGCAVVGMVRLIKDFYISTAVEFRLGDVGSLNKTDIDLSDVDVIIHTAGRAHIMNDSSSNPLEEFRQVNTTGTLDVARLAADSGVKRFVFLSSIKVNGEMTKPGHLFTPDDVQLSTIKISPLCKTPFFNKLADKFYRYRCVGTLIDEEVLDAALGVPLHRDSSKNILTILAVGVQLVTRNGAIHHISLDDAEDINLLHRLLVC